MHSKNVNCKAYPLLMTFLLSITLYAYPQHNDSLRYKSGGFGHFIMGPVIFAPGELGSYIQSSNVTNTSIQVRTGIAAGGEGMGLINNFLIGGGGYGFSIPSYVGDSATTRFSMGFGYFKMGYVIKNQHPHLLYVYGDWGFGGLDLEVQNLKHSSGLEFNRRHPIPPGEKRNYSLAGFSFSPGISWKYMINPSRDIKRDMGGLMFGLDAGLMMFLPSAEWQFRNEAVIGPPIPFAILSPYFRLSIGGGGFNF